MKKKRSKFSYLGAPACFALELACRDVTDAFDSYGLYLVGSCLERPDWRDVDLRLIMSDEAFAKLFPHAGLTCATWESDTRWLLLTKAISDHLSKATGLPVDFQFQAQSFANKHHPGKRSCVGMQLAKAATDHVEVKHGD